MQVKVILNDKDRKRGEELEQDRVKTVTVTDDAGKMLFVVRDFGSGNLRLFTGEASLGAGSFSSLEINS